MAIDRSVLDEIVGAVEPADAKTAAAARQLLAARGAGLGRLEVIAVQLAAAKRTLAPAVDRRVMVACAADHHGQPDAAPEIRLLLTGGAPLPVLARAASAKLMVVDCGVRGGAEADFAETVVPLRVGDSAGDPHAGDVMTGDQALTSLQTGVALVLSLASEGVDLLGAGAISPGAPVAATRLSALLSDGRTDPLAALARAGGFELGAIAGMCLAAAAIRVPVVVDGPGATVAAQLAARLAPAAADYLIAAPDLGVTRSDGTGAALTFLLVDAAARLLRELRSG